MQLSVILQSVVLIPLLATSALPAEETPYAAESLCPADIFWPASAANTRKVRAPKPEENWVVDRLDANRLAILATPLSVPRPVGSPEHRKVRDHLVESIRQMGAGDWIVEVDSFEAETPGGPRKFDNIVATWRPGETAPRRRIVLAAHYDSKQLANFVGATDSAVPCALLLLVAEALQRNLAENAGYRPSLGVQLVFFDGEEAFERWTHADSLYGSRHLAERWAREVGSNPSCRSAQEVEALVVLDLIGSRGAQFYYSPNPGSGDRVIAKEMGLFKELSDVETAIRPILSSRHRFFQWPQLGSGVVQDDHVPFQEINVPTVHIIPQPFPNVWHSAADRLENIDWRQAADVGTIVYAWLVEKVGLADDSTL